MMYLIWTISLNTTIAVIKRGYGTSARIIKSIAFYPNMRKGTTTFFWFQSTTFLRQGNNCKSNVAQKTYFVYQIKKKIKNLRIDYASFSYLCVKNIMCVGKYNFTTKPLYLAFQKSITSIIRQLEKRVQFDLSNQNLWNLRLCIVTYNNFKI